MKETITEVCSCCDAENTFEWDVETEGYRAFCQHCGAELMLCNVCMSEDTKCDWYGSCCYRKVEQAEEREVNCQFVTGNGVTNEVRTVMLMTEEDHTAFASAMEGKSIDYEFNVVESSVPIKANNIVHSANDCPILNNGENSMAIRCSDGWLVATITTMDNRWRAIDVTFYPDTTSENDVADLSAYVEEDTETGELSVRVWSDTENEDYTHKIILREKKK